MKKSNVPKIYLQNNKYGSIIRHSDGCYVPCIIFHKEKVDMRRTNRRELKEARKRKK